MSEKIGGKNYEWLLLHIRNGEQVVGLFEVPSELKEDDKDYFQLLASGLMTTTITAVRNPHQLMPNGSGGIVVMAMSAGNKVIFLRSGEVLFTQPLDQASPIVKEIKSTQSPIRRPTDGLSTTPGGLVLPGQGGAAQ
jgi:hypothetical protein